MIRGRNVKATLRKSARVEFKVYVRKEKEL